MLRKIQSKMKDRKGFTLIELMIVIAILGVLAAVAIPYYNQYIENSKMRIARSNYETAIRTIKAEFSNVVAGNPPTTNMLNVLNDFGKNKNPFVPTQDAYVGVAPAGVGDRGKVYVSRNSYTNLLINDPVIISAWITKAGPVDTITLTYQ